MAKIVYVGSAATTHYPCGRRTCDPMWSSNLRPCSYWSATSSVGSLEVEVLRRVTFITSLQHYGTLAVKHYCFVVA